MYVCERFYKSNPALNLILNDLQVLQGILHGILADGEITFAEAEALKRWLFQNEQMTGIYPYDELVSLLTGILADGKIDNEEHSILKIFLSDFIEFQKSFNLQESEIAKLKQQFTLPGICALAPELIPENHQFSFTGIPAKGSKLEIISAIEANEGVYSESLSKNTAYLIVGGNTSKSWAFSCSGRKIEKAIELRKSGSHLLIVHEVDFWDQM